MVLGFLTGLRFGGGLIARVRLGRDSLDPLGAGLGVRLVGSVEVDRGEQLSRLRQRDPATLCDLARHSLQPAADDAGEAAHMSLGDREVRKSVDVQVEHPRGALGVGAVEGADEGKRREVDPLWTQAGATNRREQALDHVALRGHENDPLARTRGRVDHAEWVEVENRVAERHRNLVLSLEADGCRQFLAIRDRGQLERAQHGALVGHPDANALAEAAAGEKLTQRVAERGDVFDLAVADHVRRQRQSRGALGGHSAVQVCLHCRNEPRLNVQADHVGAGAAPEVEV